VAEVRVPATWFAQGYLPRVCARHGQPSSATRKRKFYSQTPPWLYLLLLGSVLLFLIVVLATRKTVEGSLPECARCSSERRRFLWSVLAAWFASLGLFIGAGFTASLALVVLGGAAIVAAAVWSCIGDRLRARGWLTKDEVWLDLRGVDASFANQIRQAVQGTPQPSALPVAQAGYGNPGLALTSSPVAPTQTSGFAAPGQDILPGR